MAMKWIGLIYTISVGVVVDILFRWATNSLTDQFFQNINNVLVDHKRQ